MPSSNGTVEIRDESRDEILLAPLHHFKSAPTFKNCIDVEKLCLAFNHWLNIPQDKFQPIKEAMELVLAIHIMIEDLPNEVTYPDKTKSRTHDIFGSALTINTGGYAECIAIKKLANLKNAEILKIYIQQFMKVCKGYSKQLSWSDGLVCPTEDEYKQMCSEKRGNEYLAAFKIMQKFSDSKENIDIEKITGILGQLYQIREDYINLRSREDWSKNCISTARFVFPVIHAIQNEFDSAKKITKMMRLGVKNEAIKKYVFDFLETSGSIAYTREVMNKLKAEAEAELLKYEENPYMLELLKESCEECNN